MFPQLVLAVDRIDEETHRRCEHAYQLFTQLEGEGEEPILLLTGGRFQSPADQTKPASQLLREWFLAKGVREDVMVSEDRSVDTFENISFGLSALSSKIGELPAIYARYYVVSEVHHVRRICWTMRHLHNCCNAVAAAHAVPLRGVAAIKEWCFFVIHAVPLLWFLAEKSRRSRRLLAAGTK